MTAADLLSRCRAGGIDLAAGPDGTLTLAADCEPPAALLADLARHKAGVLDLLRREDDDAVCRVIERVEGLPPGSLRMWTARALQCLGCEFCRWR